MTGQTYTILVVDDERIIRDGIAETVDWASLGLSLAGTASNGAEAYESILRLHPEIVLTDVVMPEMSGIELVERVSRADPTTRFIILSGHDEFEYAREAMHLGVRHYLLKPTSETEIGRAVRQVIAELEDEQRRRVVVRALGPELAAVRDELRAQYLRDCIADTPSSMRPRDERRRILGIPDGRLRILVLRPADHDEPTSLPSLQRICAHVFGDAVPMCAYGMDALVCAWLANGTPPPTERIREVQQLYRLRTGESVAASVSAEGDFATARALYREAHELLEHSALLGSGIVLASDDPAVPAADPDFLSLHQAIRSGSPEEARRCLTELSTGLRQRATDRDRVFSLFVRELLELHGAATAPERDRLRETVAAMAGSATLEKLLEVVRACVVRLAQEHHTRIVGTRSTLVRKVIQGTETHLADEELSLKWLAEHEVFANVDYLSSLFKRETGRRFSEYLTELRVEAAKGLLRDDGDFRVSEVAARTGFGDNPQYFSQVFKRVVGLTPTEYRAACRATRES